MSVRFNAVGIQNPQHGNVLAVVKSQRILRPLGGGEHVWDLGATLYRLELPFRGLRDAEKGALEAFFESTAEGSYQDFLFTDHAGGRWLAFFTGDRLNFRCVDDAVASSGTFDSGGVPYPTTTRESPVWDVDVELEAIPLPLVFDGTMEDVSHRWVSIWCTNGVVHEYHTSAAYEGLYGSRVSVPPAPPTDRIARCTFSLSTDLSVWLIEFRIKLDNWSMAEGDFIYSGYFPGGSQLEDLRKSSGVIQIKHGDILPYTALTPAGWNRVEMLYKSRTRAGARDGLYFSAVNGVQAAWTTRQEDASKALSAGVNFSGPLYLVITDTGISGMLYVDNYRVYGY